jgi:hypothetical protein
VSGLFQSVGFEPSLWLNTSVTTMTTARILGSGKEHRTVELVPEPLVASYLMSDSAGCIIVTIGLPDPKRIVLKPQLELHPYIYAGHSPGCCQRESWHQRSTPGSISRCSFRPSRLGLASLLARTTFWRSTAINSSLLSYSLRRNFQATLAFYSCLLEPFFLFSAHRFFIMSDNRFRPQLLARMAFWRSTAIDSATARSFGERQGRDSQGPKTIYGYSKTKHVTYCPLGLNLRIWGDS